MNAKTLIVLEIMKANLHRQLSLREFANSARVSPSHLCYLFKTQIGMPPGRYFFTLKMEKACELLTTTLLSVKEVMAEVGLNDTSHFVRHFKRTYGLTPSQYRAKYLDPIKCMNSQTRNIG
jgi:AraC-like DNA-binding protein